MIYFIRGRDSGRFKIGYTETERSLAVRLQDLQCGSPEVLYVAAVQKGEKCDEKALHRYFAPWRLHGEWFKPCYRLLKMAGVSELPPEPAPPLFDEAIFDAYERGYRACEKDVDTEAAKRCLAIEERLRKAFARNQAMGYRLADERRAHEAAMERFASDHGLDLSAWTDRDRLRMISHAFAKKAA